MVPNIRGGSFWDGGVSDFLCDDNSWRGVLRLRILVGNLFRRYVMWQILQLRAKITGELWIQS